MFVCMFSEDVLRHASIFSELAVTHKLRLMIFWKRRDRIRYPVSLYRAAVRSDKATFYLHCGFRGVTGWPGDVLFHLPVRIECLR